MRLLWRVLKMIFGSLFLAAVTLIGAPLAFGATVLAGLILLPLPATIPIPKAAPTIEPTVIYDRNGNVIATLQQFDRNIPVTKAEIPQVLKEAVIADEDRDYYHHGGVDLRGTLRAAYEDIPRPGAGTGRLDDNSAVREARLHRIPADPRSQDPRSDPREPAGPRGQQGRDPVPLHDLDLSRGWQLRGRCCVRDVLPPSSEQA